jgi:hypothetical protein
MLELLYVEAMVASSGLAKKCAHGWRELGWCIVKQLMGLEENHVL